MIGTGYIYNLERHHGGSLKASFPGSMVSIKQFHDRWTWVCPGENRRERDIGSQEWERTPLIKWRFILNYLMIIIFNNLHPYISTRRAGALRRARLPVVLVFVVQYVVLYVFG
jgi:hypothetical protein